MPLDVEMLCAASVQPIETATYRYDAIGWNPICLQPYTFVHRSTLEHNTCRQVGGVACTELGK
jgi:hypothetical protein